MAEPLLTELQVATAYGLRVGQLRALRHRGGGPAFIKLGSSVRYRASDIDAWLEEHRVSSTSDQEGRR